VESGKDFRLELRERFVVESSCDGEGIPNRKERGLITPITSPDRHHLRWFFLQRPFRGAGEANLPSCAVILHDQISLKTPRADPDEGHAIAMPLVHVGLKLKDISAERGRYRINFHFRSILEGCYSGMGARGEVNEGIEERLDTEIGQG